MICRWSNHADHALTTSLSNSLTVSNEGGGGGGADVNKDAADPARSQMAATWLTGPYWCVSSNLCPQLVLEQPERAEAAACGGGTGGGSTESVSG